CRSRGRCCGSCAARTSGRWCRDAGEPDRGFRRSHRRLRQVHGHDHFHGSGTRAFAIVTLANLAYTVVEAGYGFATDSLALLSDALHNLGDVLGLGLAWGAAVLARRAPTE